MVAVCVSCWTVPSFQNSAYVWPPTQAPVPYSQVGSQTTADNRTGSAQLIHSLRLSVLWAPRLGLDTLSGGLVDHARKRIQYIIMCLNLYSEPIFNCWGWEGNLNPHEFRCPLPRGGLQEDRRISNQAAWVGIWLCHLPAVWFWDMTQPLKTGTIIVTSLQRVLW